MLSPVDYERARSQHPRPTTNAVAGAGCVAQAARSPLGVKGRSAIAARRNAT